MIAFGFRKIIEWPADVKQHLAICACMTLSIEIYKILEYALMKLDYYDCGDSWVALPKRRKAPLRSRVKLNNISWAAGLCALH